HGTTGAPIAIGPIEKMSKSRKNTVDPDDIIASFGADTARWFMLSDSPPERDVIWTEEGVQGAARFVQRVWRLVGEIAEAVGNGDAKANGSAAEDAPEALAIRKAAHRALAAVEEAIEGLRFNVAVAKIYELANALQALLGDTRGRGPSELGPAFREAVEIFLRLLAPMMPHLAEECWRALGAKGLVAEAPWPVLDRSLLVEEAITLPVQVNGKKRADVTVARDADQSAIEAAVLSLDAVRRATEGRPVRKIIVVPQRIVNVVA
ncbi:MAG: class I tRNA ligase family protein, partial [Microvirga sp.]